MLQSCGAVGVGCVVGCKGVLLIPCLVGGLFLVGCADQNFKAEEPVDYKDNAKYGFGSLIKDKNSVLRKYFSKEEAQDKTISVEKVASASKCDGIWSASMSALKDFPIEFMDKKSGRIETETVKVLQFDSTETCSYKVFVKVLNDRDVSVVVASNEDAPLRLKKHAELLRSQILDSLKKQI
ncbi:MAG: hypothetical protein IJ599_01070 [Alphaproteobacteria bacterium]|nr:hypothetical protein [Alphaproteobacteria bacterium]